MNIFRKNQSPASNNPTKAKPLFFGDWLPFKAGNKHFFVAGNPGSGKTLTFKMLMNSALSDLSANPNGLRAVVFDVKQDMLSILDGIGIEEERVFILNPFDRRCFEWDMAVDIDGPDTSLQMATIFIPEENGSNRYFSDAARDLLTAVMNVFIERKDARQTANPTYTGPYWRLADIILAFRSPARLRHVLSQTSSGRDLAELHLSNDTVAMNVLTTARSRLAPFEVIAAQWSYAGESLITIGGQQYSRRMSLQWFLQNNAVLVLGNNQQAIAPIQAINRIIFQRLTELVLGFPEIKHTDDDPRTWFFLDEVRKMGMLKGLDDLLNNGRSKGAAVVLGFQDIDGMRSVYGPHISGELTTMCSTFGILAVSGTSTPEWASQIFGDREDLVTTRSTSFAQSGQGFTATDGESESWRLKRLFLPSEFTNLPLPEKGGPLIGYFRSPFYAGGRAGKGLKITIPSDVLDKLLPADGKRENFLPWLNKEYKVLREWTDADYVRMNIAPMPHAVPAIAPGPSPVGHPRGVPQPSHHPPSSNTPTTNPGGFIDPYQTS